jgi:hypothetical protein
MAPSTRSPAEGQSITEVRAGMSTTGQRFAYGEPERPVEVIKEGPSRSNKVRVRWLDGEYEGLEE